MATRCGNLPSATSPAVTPSPYGSLQALESLFHFVAPDALVEAAHGEGLRLRSRRTEPLPAGKAFEVLAICEAIGDEVTRLKRPPEGLTSDAMRDAVHRPDHCAVASLRRSRLRP